MRKKKKNINTATAAEIAEMAMIGEEKAETLVAYRDARGPFSSFADIKHVPGFAEKLVESLDVFFVIDEDEDDEDDRDDEEERTPQKRKRV